MPPRPASASMRWPANVVPGESSDPTPCIRPRERRERNPAVRLARMLVERPRLFALLDRGTAGRVTLVSAPAGSGKSMLLSSWLRTTELPSAWVEVERDEADATRFWATVMDALRRSGAIGSGDPLATLVPAALGDEFTARLLEGLGRLQGPVVLVLDDVHHLRSEEALSGLELVLTRAPAQLRAVLVSRRD